MPRLSSFSSNPEKFDKYKSLRSHAREAAEYLTGLPYQQPENPKFEGYTKPGRGASGESSN
jgi:hypothetical protein